MSKTQISVGNSYSKITGLTARELSALRQKIAFKSEGYAYGYISNLNIRRLIQGQRGVFIKDYQGITRPVTRFNRRPFKTVGEVRDAVAKHEKAVYRGYVLTVKPLVDARGAFPTGLLRRVRAEYPQAQVSDTRIRPRSLYTPLTPKYPHTPYPEQSEAAAACAERNRGVVVASTGVGKSLIIAQIIANLQTRTLVVVPSLELKRQTTETLTDIFGQDAFVSGAISVENVAALDPNTPGDYGALILDEWHHAAAATYQALNRKAWANIYYRFGLTATPFRNDSSELILLESLIDEVIYEIPYQTAVDKGYIVPFQAYYIDVPPTKNVKGETWAEVYGELVVNNVQRNELVSRFLANRKLENASTICIVKEIEHGEALSDRTGVPFANGQDGNASNVIREFCTKKTPVIVGTQGVLGEGVDTRCAEYVVIAGLGKSRGAFMQAVGRCFRVDGEKTHGTVIIFRDTSHKWTLRHFDEQCLTLKDQYGIVVVRLPL